MDQVEIRPVDWSDDAARVLARAVPFAAVADLMRQIDEAGARLFEVIAESGRVGFYLLRVDRTANGAEGVIVAAAGGLGGVDLVELILPAIEKQFIGCGVVRIHTARPGLAKKLSRVGYTSGEIVLRKTL